MTYLSFWEKYRGKDLHIKRKQNDVKDQVFVYYNLSFILVAYISFAF